MKLGPRRRHLTAEGPRFLLVKLGEREMRAGRDRAGRVPGPEALFLSPDPVKMHIVRSRHPTSPPNRLYGIGGSGFH
jgi:hypothetical protein